MSSPVTATSHAQFLVSRGAQIDESGASVTHFGDPEKEFDAFAGCAALIDRTTASCLVQDGADALDLLHRLSTNDLISLEPGDVRFTVLTSERGRIIDVLQVVVVEQGKLLLLSDSPDAQQAVDWIEKFTIIEDSEVRDASFDLARIALIGPDALKLAGAVFGVELAPARALTVPEEEGQTVLAASKWGPVHRVDVITPNGNLEATWDRLVEAGAVAAGGISFEAARIAHGIPLAGTELTEESNPLEVNLKDLVSFTKGCYIGQEVVARLDTYDKLQKRLVVFEGDSAVEAGTKLTSNSKRAGAVTSVSPLSGNGKTRALGFARRGFWTDGATLEFEGGEVTVRELGENSQVL